MELDVKGTEKSPQIRPYVRCIVFPDLTLVRLVERKSVSHNLRVNHINAILSDSHQVRFIQSGFALQTWFNMNDAASSLKSPLEKIYYAVVPSYPPPHHILPSPVFMFDTYRARSDIDVTIANDAASMWATFEWRVDEWELSDHNMITVR
ncbi:hypothetical protein KR067_004019 [Drosophila pandora]|nr:hypothetical protein KR067_004019 [Drosophila pandora]